MIAIVTDSTSDLPKEVVEREGIQVVSTYINIGQDSLRDGVDITREEFYRRLPALPESPKTASPAPGEFVTLYDRLLQTASHVVSIHLANQLSGVYAAATVAREQVDPNRIVTIDTGQVSMGLGWAVLAATKAARESANLEDVLNSTQDALRRVKLYAVLDTLKYLARSGRVDFVRLGLGTLLNIKPLIEVRQGEVEAVGRIRTWSKATAALLEQLIKTTPISTLAILHTNLEDQANEFLGRVRQAIAVPDEVLVVNVTPTIGVHTGPGALGFAVLKRD